MKVEVWVEPCAAESGGPGQHGVWCEWMIGCSHCGLIRWDRWTQERFAVAVALEHQRRHEMAP